MNYHIEKLVGKNIDNRLFIEKFAPFIHSGNCVEFTDCFNTAYMNIERNANPRILFLDLSMKISKLLKRKELEHV